MIQGQINGGVFLGRSVLGGASLPNKAINPNPANLATGVNPIGTVLSWTDGGGGTLSYDVWIDGVFQGNQVGTSFDPGVLLGTHAYTWRIDSVNGAGTTTGDVWTFNTMALFDYTPNTEIFNWTDSGGAHAGTLAQFYASPDFATTTRVDFLGNANILTITGVQSLVHLDYLDASFTSISALDVSHSPALTFVSASECYNCMDFIADHCPILDIVYFDFTNPMFANLVDVSECPLLQTASFAGANPFVGIYCTNDVNLTWLAAGRDDQLVVLEISGCSNIQTLNLDVAYPLEFVDLSVLPFLTFFSANGAALNLGIGSLDNLSFLNQVIVDYSLIPDFHAASTTAVNISGSFCIAATYVDVSNSSDLLYFTFSFCDLLTEIDGFSTCPLLSSVSFSSNPLLTLVEPLTTASSVAVVIGADSPIPSFSMSSTLAQYVDFTGCALDTASVDAILVGCDLDSISNGELYLGGGTNAAPTGGALNPNYVDLTTTWFWTVLIN